MNAKFWGLDTADNDHVIQKLFDSLSVGDIVQVAGKIKSYQNKLELHIDEKSGNAITKLDDGQYDLGDFMKKSSRDIPQMIAELH